MSVLYKEKPSYKVYGGFSYILASMSLTWSSKMRFVIVAMVASVLVLVLSGVLFAIFYKVPSCTDRKQNQGEEGVDCGGGCAYLCTVSVVPPEVSLPARTLQAQGGRTDIVAYVTNPNKTAAAKAATYRVELFGEDGGRVGVLEGVLDLPPASTVPVFIPAASRAGVVTRAFLTMDTTSIHWYRMSVSPTLPKVLMAMLTSSTLPRVTATLSNETFDAMYSAVAVAVVFDDAGNAIAASQTLIPAISPRTGVPVTFTWNAPFQTPAARVEITPVLRLP